ncbi:DNA repair exonuclease subunit 2 protein [Rhizobium phage RHph_N1_15]|nr:DNA repair exonuclease subunit 2 protein [Rhizobium phage RHph_N1_10]QIG69302.1 DNA repair exonuclease subunit 2 protein [Rhizobium phage RHph_N1_15]QIG75162.1 DNA repair exonuclease subunit 2 protein [Rhizobium phage RHph_N2_6]
MKFTSLTIESFMAITEAKFALADRGLVLIQGVNLDDTSAKSNGAGKSSIFDALCWCLFGVTARDEAGDAIVNDKAGKNTRVVVEINDNGHTYLIARHRKHKQHKNALMVSHLPPTLGAAWGELTKGTDKLTQEVVDKILGCSLDVFVGSIYAGQERMPDLPGMTDKQLKLLIEEASGVTVLEAAYGEARNRAQAAKLAAQSVVQTFDNITLTKDHCLSNLTNAQGQRALWETERSDRVTQETGFARDYVQKVRDIEAQIQTYPAKTELETRIKDLDDKIAAVGHEQQELRDLQTAAALADNKVAGLRRDLQRLASDFAAKKDAIAQIEHNVGCPCDSCGREMTAAEVAPAKTAAVKQANAVASEHKRVKQELEDAQNNAQKLTSERDAFQASMTDVSQATQLRSDLQVKLNEVNHLLQAKENEATRARQHADRAKGIKVEPNPHDRTIDRFKAQLEEHEQRLADLAGEKDKADTDVAHADAVVKVFSPAGVRAHIMDEVTPFLNQRTAHYLGILSDGNISATWTTLVPNAKGELKEKFSIEVENTMGGKRFGLQSGGEKRKVRIACALALQDLVATRATKPIDIFLGDEIDDALDDAGLERLMQLLEEKAKERGSVFVISHRSLRDWIPQVIEIQKQNGETTVKETA